MLNGLTIDLEDWFQVSNVEHLIPFAQWGECESRLVPDSCRLLELLARAGVRATFFVLGWNAERFPGLIQEIAAAGHELGSHGYAHRLVYEQTPEEFASDLLRANEAIGAASGLRPRAYRAPSFSITPPAAWAFDILAAAGFDVDASVFPIFHERYGFRGAPRLPHQVVTGNGEELTEVPPAALPVLGRNYPFAGGAYFRLLPYPVVRRCCQALHRAGEPAVFYFHPWELDPGIPRFRLSPFRRLRSYANLHRTEARLGELLRDFRFGTLTDMLAEHPVQSEWDPQALRRRREGGRPATLQPVRVWRKERRAWPR